MNKYCNIVMAGHLKPMWIYKVVWWLFSIINQMGGWLRFIVANTDIRKCHLLFSQYVLSILTKRWQTEDQVLAVRPLYLLL